MLYILSLLKDFLFDIHHWLNNTLKRKRIQHIKSRPCSKVIHWHGTHNCKNIWFSWIWWWTTLVGKWWFWNMIRMSWKCFSEVLAMEVSFAFCDALSSKQQDCFREGSLHSFAELLRVSLIRCSWMIWSSENWWWKYQKIAHYGPGYKFLELGVLYKQSTSLP